MSAPLFVIEQTLLDLEELRAQVLEDGDAEAVAAVDAQVKEWLTAEAAKVTSYVGLIRSREATVAAAKAERDRVDAILKQAQADVDRLKANALAVMQRFGVKELKATPGGGLRRQGNGGVEPLELEGVLAPGAVIPTEYFKITVTMPYDLWWDQGGVSLPGTTPKIEPDTERIREVLKQRVPCIECGEYGRNTSGAGPCPKCEGSGTIPATVHGARLLERGEHVRVI